MRYILVLDRRSPIGLIYDSGSNDGYIREGDQLHPFLDCTEVVTDAPNYVLVTRDMTKQGKSHQSIYVPHSSVLFIQCYADEGARPLGFLTKPVNNL